MVVLVAERPASAMGSARSSCWRRNTFNPSLVFFTIALIGLLGFTSDWLMRLMQRAHPLLGARRRRGCCVASEALQASSPPRAPVVCRDVGKVWAAGHRARARGAARHRSRHRAGRVRRAPRPVRLRQEHAALSDRRARSRRPAARSGRSASRSTAPSPERSLIFQETSLFPWLTVVAERELRPVDPWRSRRPSARRSRATRCSASAWPRRWTSGRTSCRAACASASRWRARSRCGPRCC